GEMASGSGGGVYDSAMDNCIVDYNTAPSSPDHATLCDGCHPVNYCCTTSLEPGVGNFTNAPLFVNLAGGNDRLQANSPCINSGRNAVAASGLDLDGNPRIAGGTVDVGAYEFTSPGATISSLWFQQYGLPNDGSAHYPGPGRYGTEQWKEWRAGEN